MNSQNKDFPNDSRFALSGNPVIKINYELIPGIHSYGDARARIIAAFEKQLVTAVLERHNKNLTAAAKELKMDRKHLHEMAKRHGLRESVGLNYVR